MTLKKQDTRLPGKLGDALGELEAALHAWDEAEKQGTGFGDITPTGSGAVSGGTQPQAEPLYDKALVKALYKQLQDLSKD